MKKKDLTRFLAIMLSLVLIFVNGGLAMASSTAVDVTKIVLTTNELSLSVEDTSTLTATAVYSDNSSSNVTVNAVWSSNNSSVATVYNGIVTAKEVGTATIVAVFTDTDGDVFSQATIVTVTKKVKALTQSTQTIDMSKGNTSDIVLTATYSDNTTDATVANQAVWTTSDATVATVVNGKVTGVSSGIATITGVYGKKTITVIVNVDVAKRITLNKTYTSLLLNEEEAIVLTATFPDGTTKVVTNEAVWSSSNENVADVLKGKITAYKQGTALITAKYGTKTTTIEVEVDHTSKLTVDDQSVFLKIEGSQQLVLTASYPDGTTKDVTSSAKWSSTDTSVAYVNKGKISGYTSGEATITGTYGDKSVEIDVDVAVARYLDLTESIIMDLNASKQLTLIATYADGTTEDVASKATWTSSADEIAFVKKGLISSYSAGSAIITATYGAMRINSTVEVGAVNKLSADENNVSLQVNGTKQIVLTAISSDGNSSDVASNATWSSSDKSVATVSKGLIKGSSIGTATITATFGTKTTTITVEVGAVSKLSADESNVSLQVSGTKQIVLTAISSDGSSSDVASNATWSSSDKSVATVSKGMITGISIGTATISGEYNGTTVTIAVEVGVARNLTLSDTSINLQVNGSKTVKLTANLADGSTSDVTSNATWSSSDNAVAYVSKGTITGYKEGTATITASFGTKTVTTTVSVGQSSHLKLDYTKLALGVNQEKELTLTSTDVDGTSVVVSSKAVWSSDNETVAYVSNTGKIRTYSVGTAIISATYGGKTASVTVSVGSATKLTASSSTVNIEADDDYQVSITAAYKDGASEIITDEVQWSSSDTKIAEVDGGLIKGVKVGSTVVKAKYGDLTVSITVNVGLVDDLVADVQVIALSPTETQQITLSATDSDGVVSDVTTDAKWTTSKGAIAGVKNGFVTAYAKGKATVTAEYGGQKTTINIEVDQVTLIQASVTNLSMKSGESEKVSVTITLSDGRTLDVTDKAVWKTSSYKIATVSNGTVKAVAYGKTSVTATYAGKSVKVPVTVDILKYLTVDKVVLNLTVGQTVQLSALATYVDGSETDVTKRGLWTTSKNLTASVKDGLITANSKGTANLTVKYGNVTTKIKVVVTAK